MDACHCFFPSLRHPTSIIGIKEYTYWQKANVPTTVNAKAGALRRRRFKNPMISVFEPRPSHGGIVVTQKHQDCSVMADIGQRDLFDEPNF